LLEIVAVSPFFTPPIFAAAKIFQSASEKMPSHSARQIIEIPHDLAATVRVQGRSHATDYQP
jgi:hypothetical protein